MKNIHFFILIFLSFISCKPHKISEKSIELNNKAINSIIAKKYSDALKYSEEAIKADEKNYNAYTIKAQVLITENKFNEAEKTIQEQLKIKPDFAEGWIFKGLINDLNANQKQANKDYLKSIELFEKRNKNGKFTAQSNDTNIYFSLFLIGDSKSQKRMSELEKKWKNNKSAYETMINIKNLGKKELIKQMFIK